MNNYDSQIKSICYDIAVKYDFNIISMETDSDHIHLLVKYNPKQSVLEFVRLLKQITTYRIWRQNNNDYLLSKEFWKEKTFWSDGYFACSVGYASKDVIDNYIKSQG